MKKGFAIIELIIFMTITSFTGISSVIITTGTINKAQEASNLRTIESLAAQLRVERMEYMLNNKGKEIDSSDWPTLIDEALEELSYAEITDCVITDFKENNFVIENCKINDSIYKYDYINGAQRQK